MISRPMIDAAAVRISGGDFGTYGFAVPRPVQAASAVIRGNKQRGRSMPER